MSDSRNGVKDYKTYHLDRLNSVAGLIETSVVLDLQRDAGNQCSQANQEGARSAAVEFIGTQRLNGKQVSIMLAVPKLPIVAVDDSPTVKEFDIAVKQKSNSIHVHQPSEDSQSDSEDYV